MKNLFIITIASILMSINIHAAPKSNSSKRNCKNNISKESKKVKVKAISDTDVIVATGARQL